MTYDYKNYNNRRRKENNASVENISPFFACGAIPEAKRREREQKVSSSIGKIPPA
jgi:hypothetical protein